MKLVRESIIEMEFERNMDPKKSLGIGVLKDEYRKNLAKLKVNISNES